jgi:hypothetical protein
MEWKMNVEKFYGTRISRQPSQEQVMIDQKRLETVEYFNCFGSIITNGATFTREIKPRMALAIKALNKIKAPFTSQLELKI